MVFEFCYLNYLYVLSAIFSGLFFIFCRLQDEFIPGILYSSCMAWVIFSYRFTIIEAIGGPALVSSPQELLQANAVLIISAVGFATLVKTCPEFQSSLSNIICLFFCFLAAWQTFIAYTIYCQYSILVEKYRAIMIRMNRVDMT